MRAESRVVKKMYFRIRPSITKGRSDKFPTRNIFTNEITYLENKNFSKATGDKTSGYCDIFPAFHGPSDLGPGLGGRPASSQLRLSAKFHPIFPAKHVNH